MRKRILVGVGVVFVLATWCSAALVPPWITGNSTATLVEEGSYAGWYEYTIDIEWDLDHQGAGLSHWDMVLKMGCAEPDHIIVFDWPAGYSTSADFPDDPMAMGWSGYFERNGDGTAEPVVKFNSPHVPGDAEAGAVGSGWVMDRGAGRDGGVERCGGGGLWERATDVAVPEHASDRPRVGSAGEADSLRD